ncbi:MAG: hypothetical protein LHV68_10120 [Elusimicrobia bacterium]|nr:hypothetical protein [Candidatus Liberimonas magnetica]
MNSDFDHVISMLETAEEALRPLINKVVFTGGVIVPLYAPQYKEEIRLTEDVDVVIEVTGRIAYSRLESKLRKLGLKNDRFSKVICRWSYNDVVIDVMPTDEKILGFTNIWYEQGMERSVKYVLPSKHYINMFALPYLISSKLEAFNNRAKGDYRFSKDMEDIIFLISYSDIKELFNADKDVREYIASEFKRHIKNLDFVEVLSGYFHKEQRPRVKNVMDFINKMIVVGTS